MFLRNTKTPPWKNMVSKKLKLPIDQFPKNHKVTFRGDFFSCRTAPNDKNHNRLGVNFKSKSFKTAVLRNRLKRAVFDFFRVYSSFFQDKQDKTGKGGTDLLITLNPAILNLTNEEIHSQLKNHANYN